MANAFDQFDEQAKPANPFDQFDPPAGPEHLPGNPFSQFNDTDLAVAKRGYVGKIMDAFGQGFHEGWGEEKLGLSAENRKFLLGHEDTGDYSHPLNPMLTFRDRLMAPLISASEQWDAAYRAVFSAVPHGLQAAGVEAGLPRDIVALPEAFMGMPHPLGIPKLEPPLPSVKPSPIRPPETKIGEVTQPIDTSVARSVAAKTGTPEVDAVLTAPTTQIVVDNAVVDRQYDVPYMAGGSVPMEDPTVYVDRHVPRQQTAPRASGPGTVTFDPADAWIIHENVEQHVMEMLTKNGMSDQEAYRVAHFEYAEKAEQAWYRAHDIDQVAAEKEQMSWLPRIQHENPENPPPNLYEKPYPHDSVAGAEHEAVTEAPPTPQEIARAREIIAGNQEELATGLQQAYPIQGEFAEGRKTISYAFNNLMDGRIKTANVQVPEGGGGIHMEWNAADRQINIDNIEFEHKGTGAFSAYLNHIEALSQDNGVKSVRFESILNDRLVPFLESRGYTIESGTTEHPNAVKALNITHFNGQPILPLAMDLGVIGEPRPSISEGKPADAAAASMGGGAGKKPPPPPGGGPPKPPQPPGPPPPEPGANPWRDRFEHFVGKLETPDDVKQLIRNAADEQGEFPAARQGDIKLNHVDDIAQAAGVDPGEINVRGLGRELKNDGEVRIAMQLMLQLADNMKTAAREVKADASPENLIKFQESIMRRDLAVEQIVGLRAEWGRTGNVFQEFLRDVKDQQSLSDFLKEKKGRTATDLKDIAGAIDQLDKTGAARFANDMRTPGWWDKFMYYWVNALISGPTTHAKYILANAAFAGTEASVVTPIAGAVGAIRRGVLGGQEGVFAGEAAARIWGIVAGTPDAFMAAAKAARTGLQTPLPGQIAQNIAPRTNLFGQKPIGGVAGTIIGIPSRGASAIHSFFNFLGYRASIEAQGYRTAAKEGLNPTDSAFWERRQNVVSAPTVDMMNTAIEEGARLTYINELSPELRLLTAAARKFKIANLVMPFMHIPFNILSRGIESTPAAFLLRESREDIFGKNGAAKQDMAIARMVAGSAMGAYVGNLVLNDRATGYGPTDPKERAQWLATGHQPYSVRIGDQWISYNRFGSIGTALGLMSNLSEVIPHLQGDSEDLTKGLTLAVHSVGKLMEDEVGMQGLAGIIEAVEDPERKGTRFISSLAGSFLPFSSALRQTASAMDPEMREAKTVVDGLRYYIPGMRQQLLPKRDWLGAPITNAGYGGDLPIPGTSAIIQHRSAEASAIASEMQRLDLHPAVPQNKVGSVQLPPQMYDQYQVLAGSLTRASLENWVKLPNWTSLPDFARREIFEKTIKNSREIAGSYMKAWHPEIVVQNVENEINRIQGVKPTKLKD